VIVLRRTIASLILCAIVGHIAPIGRACGPEYLTPIFVFKSSPDLPFTDYVNGNIGIVQPAFGSKTLLIAYRYLNGGAFSANEQPALVEALHGASPEQNQDDAIKAWIAMRKQFVGEKESLPEIYAERKNGGHDFFPNCAGNAFETATETLKNRAGTYGNDDPNVRDWIAAQDIVFSNCEGGSSIPTDASADRPEWLRQDRDYQIAAALFYSTQFDEARARFERIAADTASTWHTTADYLVARTLVRQASLIDDVKKKEELYAQAETRLNILAAQRNQFAGAARKLIALIKYRTRPEERVRELAQQLANGNTDDLRQDVIDYVWLLDKFEAEALKKEQERKDALKEKKEEQPRSNMSETYEAIQRGELISIWFTPKDGEGKFDYRATVNSNVKPDTPEKEIFAAIEERLSRKLMPPEQDEIRERIQSALELRRYTLSLNRKLDSLAFGYEGYYGEATLESRLVPEFLRLDDLTDWLFTMRLTDEASFAHALERWHATETPAWFIAALSKAEPASPQAAALLRATRQVASNSSAYPTVAYHAIRLSIAMGKIAEARSTLDQIMTNHFEELPLSAQNQFRTERMEVASTVREYLKFAAQKPVAFEQEGLFRSIEEMLRVKKDYWDPQYFEESKAEYAQELDRQYQNLLREDLFLFDDEQADVLNRHFSLDLLAGAVHDPTLPEYLRQRFAVMTWTRAFLMKNEAAAIQIAPDLIKFAPEVSLVLQPYLNAHSTKEREAAGLYALLKSPGLSPYFTTNLVHSSLTGDTDYYYYYETAWWCQPSDTEYKNGNEVLKVVPAPKFLTAAQIAQAQAEYKSMLGIPDAKSYLGKRVLEWAKNSSDDPRLPEALFIAVKANQVYKYGCSGWQNDEETLKELTTILETRYPNSSWSAKLAQDGP